MMSSQTFQSSKIVIGSVLFLAAFGVISEATSNQQRDEFRVWMHQESYRTLILDLVESGSDKAISKFVDVVDSRFGMIKLTKVSHDHVLHYASWKLASTEADALAKLVS